MAHMDTTGVLLITDHFAVRQGIEIYLLALPQFTLIGIASSTVDALLQCQLCEPDVILLDLDMKKDPLSLIRALHRDFSGTPIIVLKPFTNERLVTGAYALGVVACQDKINSLDDLEQLMRQAHCNA